MSIFQIGSVFFALFMLYIVNIHKRKSTLSEVEVSLWYSIWVLFIVVALFPNLLVGISSALHFSRVFDLLVVVAMMIITLLVVLTYFIQKENTKKLDELVRSIAVKDAKKNQFKK